VGPFFLPTNSAPRRDQAFKTIRPGGPRALPVERLGAPGFLFFSFRTLLAIFFPVVFVFSGPGANGTFLIYSLLLASGFFLFFGRHWPLEETMFPGLVVFFVFGFQGVAFPTQSFSMLPFFSRCFL